MPASIRIIHGDCLDALANLPDESISAVVTDPPYGLSQATTAKTIEALSHWLADDRRWQPVGRGFSNYTWDAFVPPPAVWDECFRVLKPGGHMMVFAGARTHDLMGLSIRLAGFEIRDSIAWIKAQGMPKGMRISRQAPEFVDWNTTLRPANEPILMARKPLDRPIGESMRSYGTGGLNIGATRIRPEQSDLAQPADTELTHLGRWPSNAIFSHSDECTSTDCAPGCPVQELHDDVGIRVSGANPRHRYARPFQTVYGTFDSDVDIQAHRDGDTGEASRYFPVFRYCAKTPATERPQVEGVVHPSPKPLSLMTWLVDLLACGDDFTILDPFAGSGTTLEACVLRDVSCIGIEYEAAYIPLIEERIRRARPQTPGVSR